MCGVAASVGDRSGERVTRMTQRLSHRGIRSSVTELGGASVGHVRLPIVGVGEDHDQPVRRGPWTVAFVGEILDFRERDPLAECDVDLVADAWSESGPEGFRELDGFWSVVAHDARDGTVHCLVDYLSQKPLYLRTDGGLSAVASEPDALLDLGPVVLDRVYLGAVVRYGYCQETWRTPYEGVRRMTPGEYAVLGPEGLRSLRRVDVLDPVRGSDDDLRREVEAAVRRRVTSSDVSVACLLSGGLDSSIAYVLGSRHGDLRAFHAENGEREVCVRVTNRFEDVALSTMDLPTALSYHQEPIDLGSLVPQAALSDAVGRTGTRVCLTGDGADEVFGGYGRSLRYDSQASDVWHELVAWHLPRLDRVMMRNLVEVRSPFLARRVVRIGLGLPWSDRRDKSSLRRVFRGELPAGVADVVKRPLRTIEVESDRERRSRNLVDLFTKEHGEMTCRQ